MKTITSEELFDILWDACDENATGDCFRGDPEYKPVTKKQLKRISKIMKFIMFFFPYKDGVRDCEDYAKIAVAVACFVAPGAAFGEVWADGLAPGYHAQNIFVDESLTAKLFEPQTQKIETEKPAGNRVLLKI